MSFLDAQFEAYTESLVDYYFSTVPRIKICDYCSREFSSLDDEDSHFDNDLFCSQECRDNMDKNDDS